MQNIAKETYYACLIIMIMLMPWQEFCLGKQRFESNIMSVQNDSTALPSTTELFCSFSYMKRKQKCGRTFFFLKLQHERKNITE